jgi:hypothetical protein
VTAPPSADLSAAREIEASIVAGDQPDLRPARTRALAQAWLEGGHPWLALHYFDQHSRLGGPADEVFESLMQVGHLMHLLHRPAGEVLDALQRARQVASTAAQAQRVDDAVHQYQTDSGSRS